MFNLCRWRNIVLLLARAFTIRNEIYYTYKIVTLANDIGNIYKISIPVALSYVRSSTSLEKIIHIRKPL